MWNDKELGKESAQQWLSLKPRTREELETALIAFSPGRIDDEGIRLFDEGFSSVLQKALNLPERMETVNCFGCGMIPVWERRAWCWECQIWMFYEVDEPTKSMLNFFTAIREVRNG